LFTALIAIITGCAGAFVGIGATVTIAMAATRLYAARTSACCPCAHNEALEADDPDDDEADA